jgi:hypothetical protein
MKLLSLCVSLCWAGLSLTTASNVQIAVLPGKCSLLPLASCSISLTMLFWCSPCPQQSIAEQKKGLDGSSKLIFEQGTDPKTNYKMTTSTQNTGSIKVSTLLGTDLFEVCGDKCTATAPTKDIAVQEAIDPETIDKAKVLANAAPPTLPKVAAADAAANTKFLEQHTQLLQQRTGSRLRARKPTTSSVLLETSSTSSSQSLSGATDTSQAKNFNVVNGNLFNKGGALAFSTGGIVSVGGVEQWRMVVEESFPRGGVTKWLDGDSMPITEASTCKSMNIQEMVLPVEGWHRQRWGGGCFFAVEPCF